MSSIEKEFEEITKIREEKTILSDGTACGCAGCGGITINGKDAKVEDYINLKRKERLDEILNK